MGHTMHLPKLDRAALIHNKPGRHQPTMTEVEETKALMLLGPFLLISVLFKVRPRWWCRAACRCAAAECAPHSTQPAPRKCNLIKAAPAPDTPTRATQIGCDPISTMLPFTGDRLQRNIGSFKIPAASMSFANQLGMVLSVLAYDLLAVPFAKRRGVTITAMQRVGFGIVLQFLALMAAGFLEVARYDIIRETGMLKKFARAAAANPGANPADLLQGFTIPMSIWLHAIPHLLEGVSEMFVNAAVVEIFFTQVSEGTRSLANSLLLLAVGMGSYLSFALNKLIALATKKDPWISQNPLKVCGACVWSFFWEGGGTGRGWGFGPLRDSAVSGNV